ncbi:ferredoxin [Streptomyces mashuensis]|uniref:Ferredoxin n=1 Tax=Streptomyces mashuensis TaxID=33904 RepID=A0A919B9U0_9ACTN|nr:ferredoxin [Streptomyces mashuensis]GHF69201.1 ferredoxin [Streptomyces mashuensis]
MRVTADRDTCTVSSLCVYRAPEVFDQDEDGHVVVLRPDPPEHLHPAVRDAARSCPTRSIRITEEE